MSNIRNIFRLVKYPHNNSLWQHFGNHIIFVKYFFIENIIIFSLKNNCLAFEELEKKKTY